MALDTDSSSLLDTRLQPLAKWERDLRPAKSPSLVAVTAGVLAALIVVAALISNWESWLPLGGKPRDEPQAARQKLPVSATAFAMPDEARMPPAEPSVQTVAKCVGRGGTTYADGSCPVGTVADAVVIRPNVNVADGMSPESRAASLRNNSEVAQQMAAHERQVATNVDSTAAECASLEATITGLDAAARRPLSAYQQDRIREERRRARDRQFALRCQ